MTANILPLSSRDIELLETLVPAALLESLREPNPAPAAIAEANAQLALVLAALVPFIPAPALDLQLARPASSGGRGLTMHGTLLFADLSGFTALASRLATIGRRGGEEVGAILTQLFGALMAEIDSRGGRLLKFGGDTLTAFFQSTALGGSHAALASAAALAMQERMNDFAAVPTSKGVFRLRLRVGIHSGTVMAVEVGDQSHMELVINGPATHYVVMAQKSAAPGEVVITLATRELLGDARAELKLSGMYLLHGLASEPRAILAAAPGWQPAPAGPAGMAALLERLHALRSYLPNGLPSRFMRSDEPIGEFRPVTVLFLNFGAFSKLLALVELPALMERDVEIIGKVLDTYYTHIQAIVHRYGGSINKMDMATFGDRLMVLFGAPSGHEDDPHRAVRAALDIRASRKEINQQIVELLHQWTESHPDQRALLRVASVMLRQSIGIASGSVFAGIIGTPQRREYTVMGQAVQVAARALVAAQADEIVLASLTRRAVHHVVETEQLPSITLRHAARPVPIFRVLRPRGSAGQAADLLAPTSPLIGRRTELGQLLGMARQALAASGAAHIVAVHGEPGVGKSRLVEEALRALRISFPGARMIWETCQSYEQTTPYAAMSRLLRQLLNVPADDDRPAQAAAVAGQIAQLAPGWSRFAPLLGPLLNLPIPHTALTLGLSAEQQRDRIYDLLVQIFLKAAQRQPLALVVDDLHWADASSQAVLQRLMAELSGRLLLVLIYRRSPELAEPWRELRHSSTLALGELNHADGEALLSALLGSSCPPELRPVIERSIGTPLFIEEIVRYMIESGALRREAGGGWEWARTLDSDAVPARIEQLIVARLDRLGDETRALLQVAAVIGQQVPRDLLAASAPHLLAARYLDELSAAELLVFDETAAAPAFRFKHALLRDVVYGSLLFARRKELHEQVAAAIEQVYAADLAEHQAMLAQHYLRAGHIDRAFPQLTEAARQAQARYANSEALILYQQALAIAPWRDLKEDIPDIDQAASLYENMGDVQALTGNYAAARASYEQLFELLKASPIAERPQRQAALQRKIGGTHENQADLDQALVWFARAETTISRAAETIDRTIERARILSDTGWVYFRKGELDQAQQQLQKALDALGAFDMPSEQARILNRLGGLAWSRGDIQLAQHYVEQSLAASERSGNLVDQAWALNNLGILTGSQGNIDHSITYSIRAMELVEQFGSRRMMSIIALNTGCTLNDHKEYERAKKYFGIALERAIEVRDTYHHMLALLNLGRLHLALGELGAAEQAVRQSQSLALQLQLSAEQLDVYTVLSEIALRRGDMAGAAQEYQRALPFATDPESEEYGRFQRLEARFAALQGDTRRAIELLAANEALFGRLHNVPEADQTRLLLAELAGRRAENARELP